MKVSDIVDAMSVRMARHGSEMTGPVGAHPDGIVGDGITHQELTPVREIGSYRFTSGEICHTQIAEILRGACLVLIESH